MSPYKPGLLDHISVLAIAGLAFVIVLWMCCERWWKKATGDTSPWTRDENPFD